MSTMKSVSARTISLKICTIIILMMWLTPIHQSRAFIVYDCNDDRANITSISVEDIADCPKLQTEYSGEHIHVHVIQRDDFKKVHVKTCLVEVTKYMTHCGINSHATPVANGYSSSIYKLGPEMCKNVHAYKTLRIFGHLEKGIKMNATTTKSMNIFGKIDEKGNCKGGTYAENGKTWSDVVVQATVAIMVQDYLADVDLNSNEVRLWGGYRCAYLDGYCMDSTYGETFWSHSPDRNCDAALSLLYSGNASLVSTTNNKNYIVVEQGYKIFALTLVEPFVICSHEVWQTEHPKIIVIKSKTYYIRLSMPLLVENTNLIAYINSKFLYVEQNVKRSLDTLYVDTVHRRCLMQQEMLRNRLLLARVHPNAASSLLRKQKGIMGRILGNVLFIMQCVPKKGQIRLANKCYNELPITIDGKAMFAAPITHIIQEDAEEVNCNRIIPPKFQVDNEWLAFTPAFHIAPPPNVLAIDEKADFRFSPIEPIGLRGLYAPKDIENVQHELMHGIERNYAGGTVIGKVLDSNIDSQGIVLTNLFDMRDAEEYTESIFLKSWLWIDNFAQYSCGVLFIFVAWQVVKYVLTNGLCGMFRTRESLNEEHPTAGWWRVIWFGLPRFKDRQVEKALREFEKLKFDTEITVV